MKKYKAVIEEREVTYTYNLKSIVFYDKNDKIVSEYTPKPIPVPMNYTSGIRSEIDDYWYIKSDKDSDVLENVGNHITPDEFDED